MDGIDYGRTDERAGSELGELEERRPRRLKEHVLIDADGSEIVALDDRGECSIFGDGFVALERDRKPRHRSIFSLGLTGNGERIGRRRTEVQSQDRL